METPGYYQQSCYELLEFTADYEMSWISGEEGLHFTDAGDFYEAEFDMWQVEYREGMDPAILPLAGPLDCPAGAHAALWGEGDLDRCVPCPAATPDTIPPSGPRRQVCDSFLDLSGPARPRSLHEGSRAIAMPSR